MICSQASAGVQRQNKDMALQLASEEPEAGPWRAGLLSTLAEAITRREPGNATPSRPVVLAIDGRSNAGKTTLAARIRQAAPGSAVVHAGDIAWQHSRSGWAGLLIEGILEPVHQNRAVSYRPPRRAEHGRGGSIEVATGCPLLVIEGDGAGRQQAADLIDALIWVQPGEREAGRRVLARTGKPDEAPALRHHRQRMAEEIPFNTAQRTWERAGVIISGTPQIPRDPVTEITVAPPLPQAAGAPGRRPSPGPE